MRFLINAVQIGVYNQKKGIKEKASLPLLF